MALKSVTSSESVRAYIPPVSGLLHIEVYDSFQTKKKFKMMTSCDRTKLIEAASSSGDPVAMMNHAVGYYKMRIQEALLVYDKISQTSAGSGNNRIKLAAKVVGQLSDYNEAQRFIFRAIGNDRSDLALLKRELGDAIKPILGYPNGYYALDLEKDINRQCLLRLCEISETQGIKRMGMSKLGYGLSGDTSQYSNFSSFRNSFIDQIAVEINSEYVRKLPKSGILEFDFSSDIRPTRNDVCISDIKLVKLLVVNCLLRLKDQVSDNYFVYL